MGRLFGTGRETAGRRPVGRALVGAPAAVHRIDAVADVVDAGRGGAIRPFDRRDERHDRRGGYDRGAAFIDGLDALAAGSTEGGAVVAPSYARLLSDEHVRRDGLRPTPEGYRRFMAAFRDGCRYARETYGPGALPASLRQASTLTLRDGQVKSSFIFYTATWDSIVVSYRRVAERCLLHERSDIMMVSPHLPELMIRPGDLTFLDAVEECYHRYQIAVLGLLPDTYPDGPFHLEEDIPAVWRRAIADRALAVLPVASVVSESVI